jgi:hypothetical protein
MLIAPLQDGLTMEPQLIPESQVSEIQRSNNRKIAAEHNGYFLFLSILMIVAAIISRRPDALLRAQFWAEDGRVWFAEAYNFGIIHALFLPRGGDFQTFPRLAASLALVFPLTYAPLVMNVLAIFIQALPPVLLLTKRFAYLGNFGLRLLMAFLLLGVPTSFEVHANVTNSMTFLALLAFLVYVAEPPTTRAWRVFDVAAVILNGVSGPFSVFLLPVAVLMYWIRRRAWTRTLLAITTCAAAVQAVTILLTAGAMRSRAPLGATPLLLARIVGGQVIVNPVLGLSFLATHAAMANAVCVIAFIGAVLLLMYVFRKALLELRLLMFFGVTLLAAALWSPQASLVQPQWQVLIFPGYGGRYWLIPVVSFLWAYVWMLGRERPMAVRALGVVAVALALWTGVTYWRYQPFVNLDFPSYAREFQHVPAGQDFTIPINPGWSMTLHKH